MTRNGCSRFRRLRGLNTERTAGARLPWTAIAQTTLYGTSPQVHQRTSLYGKYRLETQSHGARDAAATDTRRKSTLKMPLGRIPVVIVIAESPRFYPISTHLSRESWITK
jgi:hypothetical protein